MFPLGRSSSDAEKEGFFNVLAFAKGTATGRLDATPFGKGKSAGDTHWRSYSKIASYGLAHMIQVVIDVLLG